MIRMCWKLGLAVVLQTRVAATMMPCKRPATATCQPVDKRLKSVSRYVTVCDVRRAAATRYCSRALTAAPPDPPFHHHAAPASALARASTA
jgi:hypothetical protein